jgi:hypothetical protein
MGMQTTTTNIHNNKHSPKNKQTNRKKRKEPQTKQNEGTKQTSKQTDRQTTTQLSFTKPKTLTHTQNKKQCLVVVVVFSTDSSQMQITNAKITTVAGSSKLPRKCKSRIQW